MSIKKKETNIGKVRKYLSDKPLGIRFQVRDLPKISGIHVILRSMEANGEIVVDTDRYVYGKVYILIRLQYEPVPQAVYTAPTPYPLPPFLPGYAVLARHVISS